MGRAELEKLLFEAERRVAKRSPFYMAKYILGRAQFVDGKSWGWTEQHVEVSQELWNLWRTRQTRPWGTIYLLEWPRDTRKSTIGAAFILCCLLENSNNRVLLESDNTDNAKKKMSVIKQMFEDEYFQWLFGDLRGSTWNEEALILKRTAKLSDPSVATSGIGAEKTSQHYEVIVPDDLQTYTNSLNQEQIDKVIDNYNLYESLGVKGGFRLVMGTRWAFKDLGYHIEQMRLEDIRQGRPVRIYVNRKSCYKRMADGKLDHNQVEFPGLLDKETLAFKRASQGPFLFSCNYLVDPQSEESAMFQKKWLRYDQKAKEELEKIGANFYLGIDPSKEGVHAGRDDDALVLTAVTPTADIYFMEVIARPMTRDELFREIVRLCTEYPMLKKVSIETFFQQHELAAWLKMQGAKQAVRIPWVKYKADDRSKAQRIKTLQPYFENGKAYLRPSMTKFEHQLLAYKEDGLEHDDIPDAAAQTVDMMDIPLERQKAEWWKQKNWAEAYEEEHGSKEGLPNPSTIRAWQTIRAEKERMKNGRRQRLSNLGVAA